MCEVQGFIDLTQECLIFHTKFKWAPHLSIGGQVSFFEVAELRHVSHIKGLKRLGL